MTVTLVIGAAASGKSAYAESLCLGHDGPVSYTHLTLPTN